MSKFHNSQQGLSLVELMIAMVLGLILTAGIIQLFIGSKQTYRFQDSLSRVQENARFAIDALAYDVRMAGYVGCAQPNLIQVNNIALPSSEGDFDPGKLIEGMDNVTAGTTIGGKTVITGSDVIMLRGGNANGGELLEEKAANANVKLVSNVGNWQADDVLMVTDCTNMDIFKATTVSSGSSPITIAHANNKNSDNKLSKIYEEGASVLSYREMSYFLSLRDGNAALPSLYRRIGSGTPEELVEGIQDMQILYGVDTSSTDNRQVDDYLTAAQVTAQSRWPDVVSVQMNLLLASNENNVVDAPQSITFNGATLTPTDRRLRQVYNSTVTVRNRAP